MNKKSLTNLLQEETQKFTPSPDDSTIEVTAEKVIESELLPDEEITKKSKSTKSKTPTKADLEVTIQELKESLEEYENQETELNQEIADLNTALSEQKTLAERLTTELRQEITDLNTALSEQKTLAERLAKELYETKKTALQLAESNSQLIAEMKDLKDKPTPESIKSTPKPPVKETSKSLVVNPQKSYRPAPRIVMKGNNNDDFHDKDKTWLL
ncbi:MAG: hypothetical protein F6K61_08405 [Sphaerospermopsis sp. SIO1G1]|nr:hypothetical protein [Sphaerospermopsis sp. SIO1G1]